MDLRFSYLCLLLIVIVIACTNADDQHGLDAQKSSNIRTPRSLGDVMEKVKNKIFGSRKSGSQNSASSVNGGTGSNTNQQSVSQLSPTSTNQYNPALQYAASLQGFNWAQNPSAAASIYNKQSGYNPMSSMMSQYPLMDASSLSGLNSMSQSNAVNQQSQQQQQQHSGLLSSASQLISQYLSPSGSSASGQNVNQPQQQISSIPFMNNGAYGNVGQAQQQQQQGAGSIPSSYNDFSQMLDSMVAASGVGQQRQPSIQQFLAGQQSGSSSGNGQMMGSQGPGQDHDMSASNMVPTYMSGNGAPSVGSPGGSGSSSGALNGAASGLMAPPQSQGAANGPQGQPGQKSTMVSLAEQLAPGAQYNKLISFPFSLGPSDDKDGRLKLHIPYLKQHVKRMSSVPDTQTVSVSSNSNLNSPSSSVNVAAVSPSSSVSVSSGQPMQLASSSSSSANSGQSSAPIVNKLSA